MLGINFINTIVILFLILKQNMYNVEKGLALEILVWVDHVHARRLHLFINKMRGNNETATEYKSCDASIDM